MPRSDGAYESVKLFSGRLPPRERGQKSRKRIEENPAKLARTPLRSVELRAGVLQEHVYVYRGWIQASLRTESEE